MLKLISIVAIISLSFFSHMLPLPYKGEYLLFSDIFFALAIMLWFINSQFSNQNYITFPRGLGIPVTLLSVLVVIGTFITMYYRLPGRELLSIPILGPAIFYGFRYFLTIFVLLFAYSYTKDEARLGTFTKTMLYAGLFVSLVIFCQQMGFIPNFWDERGERIGHVGTLAPHEGHTAAYMLVIIGLTLQAMFHKRFFKQRKILVFISVLAALAIIFSGRRSGWIALMLMLLFLAFSVTSKSVILRWFTRVSFVGLFVLMTTLLVTVPELREQVTEVYDIDGAGLVSSGNLAFRVLAPLAYIDYMFRNDVSLTFGAGFASTMTYVILKGGTHNQLISWFFELGFAGLFSYMFMMFMMLKLVWDKQLNDNIEKRIVLSTLLVLNVYSLAGGIFHYGSLSGNFTVQFMLYYGMALRLLELNKLKKTDE